MINEIAIIEACKNNSTYPLNLAVNAGQNLNDITDSNGNHILNIAVEHNSISTVSFLLKHISHIDTPDPYYGLTPLNQAALSGNTKMVQLLIEHSANLNTIDFDHTTPLLNATWVENYHTANAMLKYPQVNVNINDNYGYSALALAYLDEQHAMIKDIIHHPSFDATFNIIQAVDGAMPELKNIIEAEGLYADPIIYNAWHEMKLYGLRYDFNSTFTLEQYTPYNAVFNYEGYTNEYGIIDFHAAVLDYYETIALNEKLPAKTHEAYAAAIESLSLSSDLVSAQQFYEQWQSGEAILLTSGWDGHSIVFVIQEDRLYRCNRGEYSYENQAIQEFIIHNTDAFSPDIIEILLEGAGSSYYCQHELIDILQLEQTGYIEMPMQIAGNCVWTSLEAGLYSLFKTHFVSLGFDNDHATEQAQQLFDSWENHDLINSLNHIKNQSDFYIEQHVYDDMLINALQTHHDSNSPTDRQIAQIVISEIFGNDLLQPYLPSTIIESQSPEAIYQHYGIDLPDNAAHFDPLVNPEMYQASLFA